jgi:hypothetical protein
MPESDLKRVQRALSIQDVYICEAHAWADRAYDPTVPLLQPIALQIKVEQSGTVQVLQAEHDGKPAHLVRFLIGTGLRLLKQSADPNSADVKVEDLLGEVTATFVLRYEWQSDEPPTQELLAVFSDNAVHHMWPYWREFLQASTARLRLPPVVLPMRVAAPPSAAKRAEENAKE